MKLMCYFGIVVALFVKQSSEELVWKIFNIAQGSFVPTTRRGAAIGYSTAQNAVYIFGGKSSSGKVQNDLFVKFDLETKIWSRMSSAGPAARFNAVFGSSEEYFYIATGQGVDKDGENVFYDDFWKFHFSSEKWEKLSSNFVPKKRFSASGGIYNSTFFLTHGVNDDVHFSNTFAYDVTQPASGWKEIHSGTNSYNPSKPHARSQLSGVMVSEDILLIFGGCLSGHGTGGPCPSDDSWIYKMSSQKWTELNRCSSPKTSAAMARLPSTSANRIVLWGGNAESRTTLASDDDAEDEIAVFNGEKESWTIKKTKALKSFPAAREGHAMVTTKDGVVMFGGEKLSDGDLLSDIWLLCGTSDDADLSEDGRDCGRQYFNLIMLHGIFMFVGWSVFLIMGIFVARYFRFLHPTWFRLHMALQVLGSVMILAGTICGIISVPSHEHFKFVHGIFGFLLFVMVMQQPFNAMLRPQPTEQGFNCGRAFWVIWHKWSGRLVLISGIINITLGLFLAVAPSLVWILWLAYVGLWVVIFFVAEVIKRPFEKELRRRAKKPMVYDTSNPYRISRGQVNTAF